MEGEGETGKAVRKTEDTTGTAAEVPGENTRPILQPLIAFFTIF